MNDNGVELVKVEKKTLRDSTWIENVNIVLGIITEGIDVI
jgi:hypothetical protein